MPNTDMLSFQSSHGPKTESNTAVSPRRPRTRKGAEVPPAATLAVAPARAPRLSEIVAAGLDALETYAARCEQRRRDAGTAPGPRNWRQYYLLSDGLSLANPEGEIYRAALDPLTGVVRYPSVPDQLFIDRLNAALRSAGSRLRVATKHAWIAQRLRERAAYLAYCREEEGEVR